MIRCVYRDPKFDRQLDSLRKSGKKALIVAAKADEIIQGLQQGHLVFEENRLITKYGEYRILKCVKYDLGGGYRMITLWRNRDIFISYIGTHDACDRWLENNRRLELQVLKERSRGIPIAEKSLASTTAVSHPEEDDPMNVPIDEKYLRMIFCGLTREMPG